MCFMNWSRRSFTSMRSSDFQKRMLAILKRYKTKEHESQFVKKGQDSINLGNVSSEDKLESIKSLQSTIRKSEKALAQMTQKGANTTLITKRLKALNIGLAMLKSVWNKSPHHYPQEDLTEARNVLSDLFPSIKGIYAKSKASSPQKMLLKRRIKALELTI